MPDISLCANVHEEQKKCKECVRNPSNTKGDLFYQSYTFPEIHEDENKFECDLFWKR